MPQRELTYDDFMNILSNVECSVGDTTWTVTGGCMGDSDYYIQLRYLEPDIETGDAQDQHSRKWFMSRFSTKSEIVQTVLKACLTSAEHMIREHFTYKGVRVFSPHFDVESLVDLASGGAKDVRIPKGE